MKEFFDAYRKEFGKIKFTQIAPLEILVKKLLPDQRVTLEQKAYILATVYHETAFTFKPLREYGRGRGRRYGRPHYKTGQVYYGRGYVQLTWHANYKKMSDLLNIDFVNKPDLVMDPEHAYEIMILGMTRGTFTGKSLRMYINDETVNYRLARRIINGLDKATTIAKYATQFERILRSVPSYDRPSEALKASPEADQGKPIPQTAQKEKPREKAPEEPESSLLARILEYVYKCIRSYLKRQ